MIGLSLIRELEKRYGCAIIVSSKTGEPIPPYSEGEDVFPPYVWVAYSGRPMDLPIAVADSAHELAGLVGVDVNTIYSAWSKYIKGNRRRARYMKINISTV